MHSIREQLAFLIIRNRRLGMVVFGLVTLFFAAGLPHVELKTVFSDLLPADDPFVQVYKDHPNFGSPLSMFVMVKRKDGDIYNVGTIKKVWQLTRDIDLAPSVDHAQILSITTEKARYSQATAFGIDMRPLMGDEPPTTTAEIDAFRANVDKAAKVRVFLISPDETATMIRATFIEDRLDYGESFEYVQALVEQARDESHDVYLVGQPALIGWVYRYEWQMIGIFLVTLVCLVGALVLYMRDFTAVIIPIVTSSVSAIWAFGFVGWLGISIEPLLMIVPLLLTARAFSHSVQFTQRYYEIYADLNDREQAVARTVQVMLAPSVLSILTDILGIVVVVAAPIPAMVKHAIFCGMWAFWLIPTGVILIALVLACLPPPSPKSAYYTRRANARSENGILRLFALSVTGSGLRYTACLVVCISVVAAYYASQIKIGNPVEGTGLFWPDSEFNTGVRQINDHFPGVNTLEIVLEAKNPESSQWGAQQVDAVKTMQQLQVAMELSAHPPRASLSFADYLAEVNRLFNGGNPKWLPLDPEIRALNAATVGAMMGSSASNFSHVISDDVQHATVSFWYEDNKQETVDAALADARRAVTLVGKDHDQFRVRLGTGTIALQEAVNLVVQRYHGIVVAVLNLLIFVIFASSYRSFVAGIVLLIPVNIAHVVMLAAMHLMDVGLDVNSMIVAAIGLGVGIDYGIYLLSRICEEYQLLSGSWSAAINQAIYTTGRAIAFTASVMALGILPWYFLSGLKFVADMGLLLIVIMLINMVTAIIVLPLLVQIVKPRFIERDQLFLGDVAGT